MEIQPQFKIHIEQDGLKFDFLIEAPTQGDALKKLDMMLQRIIKKVEGEVNKL